MSERFDQERDDPDNHWYRQADNTPLMAGQFWALWDRHKKDYQDLARRVEGIEDRLPEKVARRFFSSLWLTTWGRITIFLIAFFLAWVLDVISRHPLHHWFGL